MQPVPNIERGTTRITYVVSHHLHSNVPLCSPAKVGQTWLTSGTNPDMIASLEVLAVLVATFWLVGLVMFN